MGLRNFLLKKPIRMAVFFIILTFLGVVGNYFNVTLSWNVNFLFGSIATLIIIYFWGRTYGVIGSILISSYTYILWGNFSGILMFTLEAVFVGTLLKRKNNYNIVLLDAIFWVVIATPYNWIFLKYYSNYSETLVCLIILKSIVNGILNSLLANFIILFTPLKRLIYDDKENAKYITKTTMSIILTNLLVGIVIVTPLIVRIVNTNNQIKSIREYIDNDLNEKSMDVVNNINEWNNQYLIGLNILKEEAIKSGVRYSENLQRNTKLVKSMFPNFAAVYIANVEGESVTFSSNEDEDGNTGIGLNFTDRDYFKLVKELKKPIISDVFKARAGINYPVVVIGVPIMSNNDLKGIVIGAIKVEDIYKVIKFDKNDEDKITIVDGNNNILVSADQRLIQGDTLNLKDEQSEIFNQSIESNNIKIIKEVHNFDYKYKYPIANVINWKIIIDKNIEPYKKQIEEYYIASFIILLIVIICVLVLGTYISKRITSSLSELALVTTRLPEKIKKGEIINWPSSLIKEVDTLINNFVGASQIINEDFKKIRDSNEILENIVNHDQLTGLPNRILFNRYLVDALNSSSKKNLFSAVMFIDLDRLKLINDTFGHEMGDKLIKKFTERLIRFMPSENVFARIGGDEFAILIPEVEDEKDINKIAKEILELLQYNHILEGHDISARASIGISIFPIDGTTPEILLKNADTAMCHAKELGKNNYQFYNSSMINTSFRKLAMENALGKALDEEELMLYYQPRVDANTEEVIGMEALLRWNSKEFGMVSPGEFIPLAEETGLIIQIGEWVLRTACKQNKAWQNQGYKPVRVSVNLSTVQFQQSALIEKVEEILEESGLNPRWLELEITESIAIKDVTFTIEMLNRFNSMGIKVSLDDFGTGFSSLNYLKNFKIDTLKIDASFIRDMELSPKSTSIVSTIITLGKNLELSVTAEGVETESQLYFLKGQGCNEIQGYLYSKPLPAREFINFLNKREWLK